MSDKKNKYEVKFLKPVKGSAYFPGDEGTLYATTQEYTALVAEGFVEPKKVKAPARAKKSGGASSKKS